MPALNSVTPPAGVIRPMRLPRYSGEPDDCRRGPSAMPRGCGARWMPALNSLTDLRVGRSRDDLQCNERDKHDGSANIHDGIPFDGGHIEHLQNGGRGRRAKPAGSPACSPFRPGSGFVGGVYYVPVWEGIRATARPLPRRSMPWRKIVVGRADPAFPQLTEPDLGRFHALGVSREPAAQGGRPALRPEPGAALGRHAPRGDPGRCVHRVDPGHRALR